LSVVFFLLPLLLLLPHFFLFSEGITVLNLVPSSVVYIVLSSRNTSKSRLFIQRDCEWHFRDMCTLYTDFRSLADVIYIKYIAGHVSLLIKPFSSGT
jgi:hypothetical protein